MGESMADVRCPMCGKPNPKELAVCQYCGAHIKPVLAPISADSQPLKPGQEPIKKNTSNFENAKYGEESSIHPGEIPTKKDTAELEQALPSWLRSLREEKRPTAGESLAEPSSDDGLSAASQKKPGPDSSGGLPDWLSGLGQAASEDEEVPSWLAGLRGGKTIESAPAAAAEEEAAPELGNEDWMTRLDGRPQQTTPEPASTEIPAAPGRPAFEVAPEPAPADNLPDWIQNLQSPGSGVQEPPATLQGGENLPDWLSGLPGLSAQSSSTSSGAGEAAPAESMPDWLDQLNQKAIVPESGTPAGGAEPLPDWLSNFESEPETPAPATPVPASGENLPDWLSSLEAKSGTESGMPAALFSSEPTAASGLPAGTPDWLSQLQPGNAAEEVEEHKGNFELAAGAPDAQKGSELLPGWLAGIDRTTAASGGMPALIGDGNDNSLGEEDKTAFPMEKPEWLSKLNPESAREKVGENREDRAGSGGLEAAELPTWVAALRPVEAVVESKTTQLDESQVTEQSGPLAGLRGVLPAVPGLGTLRKPPAYSTKLHVSEGQQRYATALDRLVASETQPRQVKATLLTSNQLWRWLISILLILAVGLPLVSGAKVAPATLLAKAILVVAPLQIVVGLTVVTFGVGLTVTTMFVGLPGHELAVGVTT